MAAVGAIGFALGGTMSGCFQKVESVAVMPLRSKKVSKDTLEEKFMSEVEIDGIRVTLTGPATLSLVVVLRERATACAPPGVCYNQNS